MKVIKNSKETFVRPKQLIWNGGTDRHTDTQTHTQTLVLSCAMQNKKWGEPLSLISPIS